MLLLAAQRLQTPTLANKLKIFSDGNDEYTVTLSEIFEQDKIEYGQLIKIREHGRVVDKVRRVVYGEPEVENIETTDVENFNSIIRERLGRFVRKTKCHAKKVARLKNILSLFQFYWNFIKPLHQGKTPAMEEGLIDKSLTWADFLHMQLSDAI